MSLTFNLAVFAAVLTLGSCGTAGETFCCLPKLWEGSEGFQIGYSSGSGRRAEQGIEGGLVRIAYDRESQKLAAESNININGKWMQSTVVQDYAGKKMYVVNKKHGSCVISPLRQKFPEMCLNSEIAQPVGSYVLGFGDNTIVTQLFNARDKRMPDVTSSVSVMMTGSTTVNRGENVPECAPVGETISGSIRYPLGGAAAGNVTATKVNFLGTIGYMNVTARISDMGVFSVPAQCKTNSAQYVESTPDFGLGSRSFFNL